MSTSALFSASRRRAAAVVVVSTLLAACAGKDEGPPPPCPEIFVVPGAESLVRFSGQGRDLTDVVFEAGLRPAGSRCVYVDGAIESDVLVEIQAAKGPADTRDGATIRYFAAISTRDRRIVAREEFDLEATFPGNQTRVAMVDTITPRIPLKPGEDGSAYLIFLGLTLTPAEHQYNRENR